MYVLHASMWFPMILDAYHLTRGLRVMHPRPFLTDVSTKNPLVFCHGLMGFDTVTLGPAIAPLQVQHWRGIRDALETNGIEVRFAPS